MNRLTNYDNGIRHLGDLSKRLIIDSLPDASLEISGENYHVLIDGEKFKEASTIADAWNFAARELMDHNEIMATNQEIFHFNGMYKAYYGK